MQQRRNLRLQLPPRDRGSRAIFFFSSTSPSTPASPSSSLKPTQSQAAKTSTKGHVSKKIAYKIQIEITNSIGENRQALLKGTLQGGLSGRSRKVRGQQSLETRQAR